MKRMIQFTLAATLLISAIGARADDDKISSSITNPFITSSRMADKCFDGNENSCLSSSSTSSTLFSTSSTIADYKEEIRQVEPDAYNFLAGEEMTLALEEVLDLVRDDSEELKNLSDIEVTTLLIEGLYL